MPKNVENFEIRTLGRDDYAQAAEIFAFVHALHPANRPDIYRKTNVPLGEDEFFKMCDDPHEIMLCAVPVSYTHLDVYKRQVHCDERVLPDGAVLYRAEHGREEIRPRGENSAHLHFVCNRDGLSLMHI